MGSRTEAGEPELSPPTNLTVRPNYELERIMNWKVFQFKSSKFVLCISHSGDTTLLRKLTNRLTD